MESSTRSSLKLFQSASCMRLFLPLSPFSPSSPELREEDKSAHLIVVAGKGGLGAEVNLSGDRADNVDGEVGGGKE